MNKKYHIDIQEQEHIPNLSILPKEKDMVAVAIKGDDDDKEPAQIIASGKGALANKILAIAFEKGIKVREDAPLAEILAQLDIDTPIPSEAIIMVAEILAKVYEQNALNFETEL